MECCCELCVDAHLLCVARDAPVLFEGVELREPREEVFVVRDDNQLKVVLVLPFGDQAAGSVLSLIHI